MEKAVELKITSQPKSVTVAEGEKAKVTVSAQGDSLTYQWYIANAGSTKFSKSSTTTATYSVEMNESRDGRQVYCVVTDKYGNSVTTDTVTINMEKAVELKITSQPVSVTVAEGEKAKVTFTAEGDGLTYEWYYAAAGSTQFLKTASFTGNTYAVDMSTSRDGRQVYCVVTDKYGNSVTTDTVTINLAVPVAITEQPVSVTVAEGKNATVSVSVQGDGLTYEWYYKNASGMTKFAKTSTFTGNTYSAKMDSSRDGRQVYCVVTDKYGNSVQTNTVTINMK